MRCSCRQCGTYMIQADSALLGYVCPDCGNRCRDCLGTDTVVSREHLKDLGADPRFSPENLRKVFERPIQSAEAETEADEDRDLCGDDVYGW